MACCLLHNFIRKEMVVDPLEYHVDEFLRKKQTQEGQNVSVYIDNIEMFTEWNNWRDALAQNIFNEWKIFGRDRAAGEGVVHVKDYVDEIQKKGDASKDEVHDDNITNEFSIHADTPTDEDENTESMCKPATYGAKKKGKKRKSTGSAMNILMEQLGDFFQSTELTLGGLAQRVGYEHDAKVSHTELFQTMNGIEGLILPNKLKVSDELVHNTERLELFLSLPENAQIEYIHMLLDGRI
ncbi:hypothetical protein ACS0TY_017094 [Phlomoides rotata]